MSILGTLNGCFLTSRAFISRKLATDSSSAGSPRSTRAIRLPAFAIVAQAVWSIVLVLTGSYESLDRLCDVRVAGCHTALMVAAVMVLRRTAAGRCRGRTGCGATR